MRRFTIRLAIAAAAVGGGYATARVLAPAALRPRDPTTSTPADLTQTSPLLAPTPAGGQVGAGAGRGDDMVLSVLTTLERRPIIAAKVRQKLHVDDQRLAGTGEYWQQGVGNQRRSRWELKTLVAGETAFFTQVYAHFPEGEYVWIDRQMPHERTVTRVDVGRVRRELSMSADGAGQGREGAADGLAEILIRGGLSQLLADLNRSFTFGPPMHVQHGSKAVLALVGRWRPNELARAWPPLAGDGGDWPAHLPHHVLLAVGVDDLFPYLVEYRSGAQASLATAAGAQLPAQDPLASYEFFEVNFASIMDERLFQFAPADSNWHDVTARVLERVRPTAPAEENASIARRYGSWR